MLDFPTPTSIGQVYTGTNGVTYIWTGTLWLARGASAGGDVAAYANTVMTSTPNLLVFNVVTSGNSGGWLNLTDGRYRPPAGRYSIAVTYQGQSPSGASTYQVVLRKNGAQIAQALETAANASHQVNMGIATTVDMNGTDYLDCTGVSTIGFTDVTATFAAFPISGIKGPPGDPYPGTVGGDFCASNHVSGTIPNPQATLTPPVKSGNSGGWYNPANGRYTPPAGRYQILGIVCASRPGSATTLVCQLRKNGAEVSQSNADTAGSNLAAETMVSATVDANGSDWFEIQGLSTSGAVSAINITFLAYPISGIKGPPGDPYPGTVGGDVCATLVGPAALATSTAVVGFPAIISGNSGGWLNTSTGAYTPPAGRYFLTAQFYGNLPGAATNLSVGIAKNGGLVSSGYSTTASAAFSTLVSCAVTVDANGSDTFTVVASGSPGTATGSNFLFTAYPITGIKGPPGDPGPAGSIPTGDFCGSRQSIAISSAGQVATSLTILSGNSGNWYNGTTGQYSPPAGRYALYASMTVTSDSAANVMTLRLRKNGVQVAIGNPREQGTTGIQCNVGFTVTLDANGTDYFDVVAYTSAANGVVEQIIFGAYPISGVKGPTGDPGAGGPPGEATTVLQTRMFQTGAAATSTALIPTDDTIPQITEGTEFMTLAFTPLSATSKLVITVNAFISCTTLVAVSAALFRDSTANALAATSKRMVASDYDNFVFTHTMTSGTTSPVTFRVRAGPNATGTLTFNGVASGRWFGGVSASSIVIQEVSP